MLGDIVPRPDGSRRGIGPVLGQVDLTDVRARDQRLGLPVGARRGDLLVLPNDASTTTVTAHVYFLSTPATAERSRAT